MYFGLIVQPFSLSMKLIKSLSANEDTHNTATRGGDMEQHGANPHNTKCLEQLHITHCIQSHGNDNVYKEDTHQEDVVQSTVYKHFVRIYYEQNNDFYIPNA